MRKYDLILEDRRAGECRVWADLKVIAKLSTVEGVFSVFQIVPAENNANVRLDPRYDKAATIEAICQLVEKSKVVNDVSELEEAS